MHPLNRELDGERAEALSPLLSVPAENHPFCGLAENAAGHQLFLTRPGILTKWVRCNDEHEQPSDGHTEGGHGNDDHGCNEANHDRIFDRGRPAVAPSLKLATTA